MKKIILSSTILFVSVFANASSYLHTYASSSVKINCSTIQSHPDFKLVLELKTTYTIDTDPTSPIGYDISDQSFDGLMSLTGYNNYSNIVKLNKNFKIDELVDGSFRNFYIFAPALDKTEYSAQLLLHSDAFNKSSAIWAPEGSEAYDLEDSSDTGSRNINGTLTLKRLQGEEDLSINKSYAWKFFVECSLSWSNSAETIHGEY